MWSEDPDTWRTVLRDNILSRRRVLERLLDQRCTCSVKHTPALLEEVWGDAYDICTTTANDGEVQRILGGLSLAQELDLTFTNGEPPLRLV